MSWKRRIREVSNAEIALLIELQRRGLTRCLETQKGFKLDPEADGVHGTVVDYFWNAPYNYAVFLDGAAVHVKRRQSERDELITKALQRRGIKVDRFMYKSPIRKRRLREIADRIEQTIKEMNSR